MENAKQNEGTVPQQLTGEEATSIAGGTATVTVGPIQDTGPTLGAVLIDIYDGFVDVTSHVIERLANSAK